LRNASKILTHLEARVPLVAQVASLPPSTAPPQHGLFDQFNARFAADQAAPLTAKPGGTFSVACEMG
jgi:hypothetical protein